LYAVFVVCVVYVTVSCPYAYSFQLIGFMQVYNRRVPEEETEE